MSSSHQIRHKEGLVLLEDHSILNLLFLVEVIPCSVCALFSISAVLEDPVSFFISNTALHLRDKLVINTDITVWGSS